MYLNCISDDVLVDIDKSIKIRQGRHFADISMFLSFSSIVLIHLLENILIDLRQEYIYSNSVVILAKPA